MGMMFKEGGNVLLLDEPTNDLDVTTTRALEEAINDFAAAVGCGNLVFGCPRNRNMPDGADVQIGVDFFRTIGEYALSRGTVIGMEANPSIYNTNYINDTPSALRLIEEVDCEGFRLNLDVGTMIYSGERVEILKNKVHLLIMTYSFTQ